jgi:hypothetical protein
MPRRKRRPGGQPGNQNARKHGLYAAHLSPQDVATLCQLINEGSVDPALALIRMKFNFISLHAPGNRRLLREVSFQLNKWMFSHYDCSRREKNYFRRFVRQLSGSLIAAVNLPEPTESGS